MAEKDPTPDQNLSKDELHRTWQGRLKVARRHLERFGNTEDRWTENVEALAGDFGSNSDEGDIDVHMIRSNIKSTLPPLHVTPPYITVVPQNSDSIEGSRHTETELNYWIRELALKDEVKEVIYDGELTNVGYVYVGWSKAKDVKTSKGPVEYSDRIKAAQPFARRLSPKSVLVPPGYKNLHEAPWCSIMFTKTLIHVLRRFGERAADIPTRDYREEFDEASIPDELRVYLKTDDAKLVDIHNVWDKETKKVYVTVIGHDKFLEEPMSWPWDVEGLPVERFQPEHISDEYFGTPPVSYAMCQNRELNATRTAMRKNRNRTKQVIVVASDQSDLADKYAQAEDGAVLTADVQDGSLRDKIMPIPALPIDGSDLLYDGVIKGDLRESSGLGAERRGQGDPNIDSATASANVEKGIQIRDSDKSDAVRTLWIGIAKKLWMVLKQHPNIERTRLIAGNIAGEFARVDYTLKALHGEYDFRLDLGSMTTVTPVMRQNRAALRYNMLRADPLVSGERLIMDIFDADQVADPSSYMLALRQPLEELQMMMTGLPVEAHERDDHITHLAQHGAQGEKLHQDIGQLEQQEPGNPFLATMKMAQVLLIAHEQDHFRHMQQIQASQQQRSGQPQNTNLARNQLSIAGGNETEAEIAGRPLVEAG